MTELEGAKQRLLFYVAEGLSEQMRTPMQKFVASLASRRKWVLGPPRFVDDIAEKPSATTGTLGGYIEIYSALPPHKLSREIDVLHFKEVCDLVDALCEFSTEHNVTLELELDGVFVGEVENGLPNSTLAEALLGEWKRQLNL